MIGASGSKPPYRPPFSERAGAGARPRRRPRRPRHGRKMEAQPLPQRLPAQRRLGARLRHRYRRNRGRLAARDADDARDRAGRGARAGGARRAGARLHPPVAPVSAGRQRLQHLRLSPRRRLPSRTWRAGRRSSTRCRARWWPTAAPSATSTASAPTTRPTWRRRRARSASARCKPCSATSIRTAVMNPGQAGAMSDALASRLARRRCPSCSRADWDLLIVGGGITGAGILLEASRRGLEGAAGRAARLRLGHLEPVVEAGARRLALPEGRPARPDARIGARARAAAARGARPGAASSRSRLPTMPGCKPGRTSLLARPGDLRPDGRPARTRITSAPANSACSRRTCGAGRPARRHLLHRRQDRRRPPGAARAAGSAASRRRGASTTWRSSSLLRSGRQGVRRAAGRRHRRRACHEVRARAGGQRHRRLGRPAARPGAARRRACGRCAAATWCCRRGACRCRRPSA